MSRRLTTVSPTHGAASGVVIKVEQWITSTSPFDISSSSGGFVSLSEGVRGTVAPSAAVPWVDRVGLGLGGGWCGRAQFAPSF
jgi:hypothetical protein